MAKYKLNKSNRTVSCSILNESQDKYLVKFKTGSLQVVDKNRVQDLDILDEAVLDAIRNFGQKAWDTVKRGAEAISNFLGNIFTANGMVFFASDSGVMQASSPVNAALAARELSCVNVIPSSADYEVADEAKVNIGVVSNFAYTGEYTGAVNPQYLASMCESANIATVYDMLTEAEMSPDEQDAVQRGLNKFEKSLSLTTTINDASFEDLVKMIVRRYNELIDRPGAQKRTAPLLIWGAPGVGKTQIINSARELIKRDGLGDPGLISISCPIVSPEDFSMPTTRAEMEDAVNQLSSAINDTAINGGEDSEKLNRTEKEFDAPSGWRRLFKKAAVTDVPKTWLPTLDFGKNDGFSAKAKDCVANGGSALIVPANANQKDIDDLLANGYEFTEGTKNREMHKDGPGGILFLDEFSRMTQLGLSSLMNLPGQGQIGINSNLKLGSRWLVICAANRVSDMKGETDIVWEAAQITRFHHVNYVPTFEAWRKWATESYKGAEDQKHVHPEIVSFIADSVEKNKEHNFFYDVASAEGSKKKNLDLNENNFCAPRTWEFLSQELYAYMRAEGIDFDTPLSEIKKGQWEEMHLGGIVGKRAVKALIDYIHANTLKVDIAKVRTIMSKTAPDDGAGVSHASRYKEIISKLPKRLNADDIDRIVGSVKTVVGDSFKKDGTSSLVTSAVQVINILDFVENVCSRLNDNGEVAGTQNSTLNSFGTWIIDKFEHLPDVKDVKTYWSRVLNFINNSSNDYRGKYVEFDGKNLKKYVVETED